MYVRNVRWTMKPAALLTGKLAFELSLDPAGGFIEADVALINEDTFGREFLVILSGSVEVSRDDAAAIGEMAELDDGRHVDEPAPFLQPNAAGFVVLELVAREEEVADAVVRIAREHDGARIGTVGAARDEVRKTERTEDDTDDSPERKLRRLRKSLEARHGNDSADGIAAALTAGTSSKSSPAAASIMPPISVLVPR